MSWWEFRGFGGDFAKVSARSAADILRMQPNTAILFYRKIRMVISHHLALAADEVFEGSVELDES